MNRAPNKLCILLICAGLALATIAAFEPIRHHEFVDFDDNEYIYANDHIKAGLTREGLVWAFASVHSNNWHPLTWLSHMLDCQIYGLEPAGHHFTNVLLHIANAILLFLVLKYMTGSLWPSAFVAAVFALHPLHIESVAWASERKDVLSTFFWMLIMITYVWYAEQGGIGRYLLVFLLLCLGLMAKQMLVTLPFVLLLLDYWPLRRLVFKKQGLCNSAHNYTISVSRCILEKLPLLVPSVVAGITVYMVQHRSGVMKSAILYPVFYRIENALVVYVAYIGKMLWPVRLAVFYPHPFGSLPIWKVAGSVLLLVCITAVAISKRRQQPYLIVGWLWYIGTLVPVIGLVQLGNQAMADRYTYIPLIGIFVMVAWGTDGLLTKWSYRKAALGITAGALLAASLICTRMQVRHWQNSLTLYEHAIKVTENNAIMHNSLANALRDRGRFDEAIMHYNKALRINPYYLVARNNKGRMLLDMSRTDEAIAVFTEVLGASKKPHEVYNDLGMAYARKGNLELAIENYNRALQISPDYPDAYFNLGTAMVQQRRYDNAVKHFVEALRSEPNRPKVYYYLGLTYAQQGQYEPAIENYNRALKLEPDNPEIIHKLAMTLEKQGRIDEAIEQWKRILKLKPAHADTHFSLGLTMAQQGKYDDAVEHLTEALRVKPDWSEAYHCLALVYDRQGKYEPAIQNYKEVLQLDPNSVDPMNRLALILATVEDAKFQNPAEAVRLAKHASELTKYEQPELLDTLAVTYAAAGKFSEAIETAEKAIKLAEQTGRKDLAGEIQGRLQLYNAGRPYRPLSPVHDKVVR